jgi:uncharacterized damage-inducible protein DinB
MTEVERILDQMKRAFEGEAWHGPSLLETLADVTAQQAAARPIPGAHSIWELALHIAAWKAAVRRRLQGDRAELSSEQDWPPITETSEAAWSALKKSLERTHQDLLAAIKDLGEANLDQPILPGMPSRYVTLHGVIQHELYHCGQIALLKRA